MDPEYGKRYRELYERHWWWRSREAAVLGILRRHLRGKNDIAILDVGCGDGLFFGPLAEFGDVEGVEFTEALLDPKGPYRSRIHVAPFDERFQPGRAYNLILMLDVLEHLPNAEGALRHASSLLARDGALLLTVPAFQILWTNHDVINHHLIRYRRKTLRPLLEKSGLAVVEERYWYQWTCPVKIAQRVAEKILRPKPKPPSVPPDWMNGMLYKMTRLEQETLGAWGVPFGSSLMTYCRVAERIESRRER